MLKTPVFRFRYFDRAHGESRVSTDYATRKAIADMGAEVVEDSGMLVDARLIGFAGLWVPERQSSSGNAE